VRTQARVPDGIRANCHTDRSAIPRRDKEPDGAPESLVGRIDPREMGSRARRDAPKDVDKKKKRAAEENTEKAPKRRAAAAATTGFGYADILEATQDVEGIRYQPRTAETRTVYELILGTVHRALGDQAQDVVRSAADTILESLKTEGLKDFDKKKEVEEVLGSMPNEEFTQLLNLSKKITDYVAEDEEMKDPDDEKKDALDDAAGVAVVWDEGEEEGDDDYEIRDESDASEDEDPAATEQVAADGDVGEESLVLGGEASKRERNGPSDSDRISPHDIDGFWLQRLLATVYSDPTTATEKTTEALSILSSESSIRDAENALMELLDFSHHEIVRILVKNRDVVVWCTKLARSDDNDRMNVEVAMRERNVGWILKELRGDRTKRRAPGADADSMEVDVQGAVPKTGTVAPGSTLPPRRVLDLDSMAFAQGGHLMSNKKTTLPPGTVKRTKKGYEEIHVPYKPIPALKVDDRVPIASLPEWTQAAFPKAITHLNRVQSKLYPVAYGTDEPILLCAPTGAGKVSNFFVCFILCINEFSDQCSSAHYFERTQQSPR
jgi:pre-mRNA-splicing helicase BRR2